MPDWLSHLLRKFIYLLPSLGCVWLMLAQATAADAPTRLLDQQPFDRVTLDVASGSETIDTLLLELPGRQLPDPFPTRGALELRRLSEPSVLYKLPWNSIAKIEFYEQLLLAESVRLTSDRNLAEAYEYLEFLHKNYPQLAELQLATEKYLRQDAIAAHAQKNHEETLTILLSLYDLNPQHRGLKNFVERVTDELITQQLGRRDYAAARSILDLLSSGFPELKPDNIASWKSKFEKGANRQLLRAQAAIRQQQFKTARRALRQAEAILPQVAGTRELLLEIDRQSPMMVVGVDQLSPPAAADSPLNWATARVTQLTDPKFINLIGFSAEGGDYRCRWAEMTTADTGLELDIRLNPIALRQGMSAAGIALELLRQADPAEPHYRADFSGLLRSVAIRQGNLIHVRWHRPHIRPEALLPLSLQDVIEDPLGIYQASPEKENDQTIVYQQSKRAARGPETILEKYYQNEEVALSALLSGEVDVLARIPPWQVNRLEQVEGVVVSPYRLPTLHLLLPNYQKPIMQRREFRRALCYGINRPQILGDILLGGGSRSGFRVLSGPLPAGITLNDPVGYAYHSGLAPRPYQPRLAAVLATVARSALAKKTPAVTGPAAKSASAETKATEKKPVAPLILAHPQSPVATTVCQSLKLQLGAVGIPVQLQPLPIAPSPATDSPPDYDLRYAELTLREPIVDARRLLSTAGLAGRCSASMSLALRDVDQAKNWKAARSRLQEVHKIAFNDLPVIPLWQTVDFFAYRQSLTGIGTAPVSLYQNVADWQRSRSGGDR